MAAQLTADLCRPDSAATGAGIIENVVMLRALRAMVVDYAAEYLQRFGFPVQNIVHTEARALGDASFTPLQLVRSYAVLVNCDYLVDPYLITKITDENNQVLFTAKSKVVCANYDLPVIYGNTPKSVVLSDDSMGNVAVSHQSDANGTVPMPRLERISQALAAADGEQLYAPRY